LLAALSLLREKVIKPVLSSNQNENQSFAYTRIPGKGHNAFAQIRLAGPFPECERSRKSGFQSERSIASVGRPSPDSQPNSQHLLDQTYYSIQLLFVQLFQQLGFAL
jgi:hypothetical protein